MRCGAPEGMEIVMIALLFILPIIIVYKSFKYVYGTSVNTKQEKLNVEIKKTKLQIKLKELNEKLQNLD